MSLPSPGEHSSALVTGASSGLGVEISRSLARRGHNLVLVARRLDRLRDLADELATEHGVRVEPVACDLGDAESRRQLLAAVEDLGLAVEVLVNNAGFGSTGRFQYLDVGREQAITRVNVEAVVALCGHFVPAMVLRERGAVLNLGSTTGFQPLTRNATYAATKAFVLSFTEALHTDLAGTGVVATALCPDPVKTELWEGSDATSVVDAFPGFIWTTAEMVAEEGVTGLEAGRRVVVPGVLNQLGAVGGQHVPRSILLRLTDIFSPVDDGR